ncbi:fumarylacetoacetate hydrolase [uncultured Pseudacidovorax sp.]|uniref:2-keto-4-pentenoate hydratase n=1 Tax=uncultured Pseudacidovorax sp. TaxID=679313 RepID=UPI0025F5131B|nr:fumarylacetoacetate hydrolase [uncultured Pseudacidovorax sp.]
MFPPPSTFRRARFALSSLALAALLSACSMPRFMSRSSPSPAPASAAAAAAPAASQRTAGCLRPAQVDAWLTAYEARKPVPNPSASMTPDDADCTRALFQQGLAKRYGALVGYKAGLTNPAVQKRFNTDQPVWGALYSRMLLDNGATVDAAFGARPLYEADLLVRVKSSAINQARSAAEVLAQVDQIIPFIELPDLMVDSPAQLNGNGVTAINVGARLGVRGTPLAVPADAAGRDRLMAQLRDMNVRLVDAQGAALGGGKGSDVLGHPLHAVVWLAIALNAEGLAMEPGQLISLGSFSALLPPRPGLRASVYYDGVPGLQPVSVQFR